MPKVRDSTFGRERPKAGLVTGVKSSQGSRIGRCGWITSFLRKKSKGCCRYQVLKELKSLLVAMRLGETPVPIPNTMVKP